MANTLTITREHLDKDNYYIGPDVTKYDGDIKLDANLGLVKFKTNLSASGSIIAEHGTGITSSENIYAGENIQAWCVYAERGISAGKSISADWDICAGHGIYAGENIKANEDIEARFDIEAGGVIEAGLGIKAGYSISCKTLSAGLPIFAGTATWIRTRKEDTQIRCEKLCGTVAYGELVINGEEVA